MARALIDPSLDPAQRSPQLAVMLALRAAEQLKRPYMLDTLAAALFQAGDVGRAIEVQAELVEMMESGTYLDGSLRSARDRLAKFRAAR